MLKSNVPVNSLLFRDTNQSSSVKRKREQNATEEITKIAFRSPFCFLINRERIGRCILDTCWLIFFFFIFPLCLQSELLPRACKFRLFFILFFFLFQFIFTKMLYNLRKKKKRSDDLIQRRDTKLCQRFRVN